MHIRSVLVFMCALLVCLGACAKQNVDVQTKGQVIIGGSVGGGI